MSKPSGDAETGRPERKKGWGRNRRVFLLLAIVASVIAIFFFDLDAYLSLEGLAANEAVLKDAVNAAPMLAAALFCLVYIIAVAFSVPGAIWLTLAGGLMFGTVRGGLLTVLAATLGASILFLAARYLIGDMLRARAGPSLQKFEASFNRDATSYLLVLRLLPIFPFFIVNLGAAMVGARFGTFIVTTFFGIMPGTFVFASIGNGISVVLRAGQEPDLSIIGKPEILLPLLGLAVLSLLPALWRRFGARSGAE